MAEIGKGGKRNRHGNLVTENFKRPDHNDFRDHSELKKLGFTGVRHNSVTKEWEIWLEGEIKALGPVADVDAMAAAYEEVFALEHVEIVSYEANNPKKGN
jgi:hypothetical protein